MKKKLIENLTAYDITNDLSTIKIEKLVAYTIDALLNNGLEPTFPYIVAACHKQFPGVFSLSADYPEYPDSLKVKEAMAALEKQFIETIPGIFRLTPEGKAIAREVYGLLQKVGKVVTLETSQLNIDRSTSRNYANLQLSKAYGQYLTDSVVNYQLLWDYLGANPLVDKKALQKFFKEINSYASLIGDKSVAKFAKEVSDALN
jgi:hypothetical protein